jgi:hypothetical protein
MISCDKKNAWALLETVFVLVNIIPLIMMRCLQL